MDRPGSDDFFSYYYLPLQPGVRAGWQLAVPPVAVAGWIPTAAGDFGGAGGISPEAADALSTLVLTGNAPPPASFAGAGDFVSYVQRKDYRAVLALDSLRIELDEAGAFASVSFYHLIRCGYTPLPPGYPVFYWPGRSFGKHKVTVVSSREIRIRLSIWFKLGRLTGLAGRIVSGYWPASANAEIEVAVFRDPMRVSIVFAGSCVPSQRRYIGWQDCDRAYDILKSEPRHFQEFLELGYCKDALSWQTEPVIIEEENLDVTPR